MCTGSLTEPDRHTLCANRGRGPRPQWPHGIVGSITHGAGWAGVVVARQREWRGLGLDIERMLVCERADRLAGEILTPSELEAFASLGDHDRAELVTRTFSLKESLFKALYPLVKQRFYFQDAEVLEATPGARAPAPAYRPFADLAQRRIGRRPVHLFRRLPAEPGQYPHRAFARLKRRWPANGARHELLRLHPPLLIDPVDNLTLRHVPAHHITKQLPNLRVIIIFHRLEQLGQPVLSTSQSRCSSLARMIIGCSVALTLSPISSSSYSFSPGRRPV